MVLTLHKKHMKKLQTIAFLLASTLASHAVTLVSYNFDTPPSAYLYGYTYGGGSFTNNINAPTAGAGTGGTAAASATFNTTGMVGSSGIGLGFGGSPSNSASIAGATSLADFTFTIDLRTAGTTGSSAGLNLELRFQAPDNFYLPADGDSDGDSLLTLRYNAAVPNTFQTFNTTLADWFVQDGSLANLQTNLAFLSNINLNVPYDADQTMPDFGNDTGNVIAADNFTLSVIPEASTASLFLLAVGGLVGRRRR